MIRAMKTIKHAVKHHYQPTNSSCGYTALSILLSFYDKDVSVEELLTAVKQPLNSKGEPGGSITAELVTWCLSQGFSSELYSFDGLMLDLSWQKLSQNKLLEKIEAAQESRDVLGLGKDYGHRYLKAYAGMLKAGGKLTIQSHVSTTLINELLQTAPVFANVCSNVMDNLGRTKTTGLREFVEDDADGRMYTHSIVIYGLDGEGNYLIADPWRGMRTVDADTLLSSIAMAQIECDNMIFQLAVTK